MHATLRRVALALAAALLAACSGSKAEQKPDPIPVPDQAAGPRAGPFSAAAPVVAPAAQSPCPEGMALLPAGRYRMGGRGDEVSVGRFCLDVTEVTVGAYTACVKAGSCQAAWETVDWPLITSQRKQALSPYCNGTRAGRADHPVNCVDWSQAQGYCRWAGKRLPTEEEWEWAARGGERGTTYPWGNAEPGSQLCWKRWHGDRGDGTCAVGSYPAGDSPQGVKDLAGNVWEWTDSWYASSSRPYRVDRGGCWDNDDPTDVSAARRAGPPPGRRGGDLGFRCARTAQ